MVDGDDDYPKGLKPKGDGAKGKPEQQQPNKLDSETAEVFGRRPGSNQPPAQGGDSRPPQSGANTSSPKPDLFQASIDAMGAGNDNQGGGPPEAIRTVADNLHSKPENVHARLQELNGQYDFARQVPQVRTGPDGSVYATDLKSGGIKTVTAEGQEKIGPPPPPTKTEEVAGRGKTEPSGQDGKTNQLKTEEPAARNKVEPGGQDGKANQHHPEKPTTAQAENNLRAQAQNVEHSQKMTPQEFYPKFKEASPEQQRQMVQDLRSSGMTKQEATNFVSNVATLAKQDTSGGDHVLQRFKQEVTATPQPRQDAPPRQDVAATKTDQPAQPPQRHPELEKSVGPPPRPEQQERAVLPNRAESAEKLANNPVTQGRPEAQPKVDVTPSNPHGRVDGTNPVRPETTPVRDNTVVVPGGGRVGGDAQVPGGGPAGAGRTPLEAGGGTGGSGMAGGHRGGDRDGVAPGGRGGDRDGGLPGGSGKGDQGGGPQLGRVTEQGGTGMGPAGKGLDIGGKFDPRLDGVSRPGESPGRQFDGKFIGLDLNDKSVRLQLVGLIKDFEAGKPLDGKALGLDEKGLARLQDFLKQLGPDKLDNLKGLLMLGTDGDRSGRPFKFDDPILSKLRDLLNPGKDDGPGRINMDFGDKQTRQHIIGLLKDFEAGKPFDGKMLGLDERSLGRLQEFFKGLNPREMDQIRLFLEQGPGDKAGRFIKMDDTLVSQLKAILEGREPGLMRDALHRNAGERLADFLSTRAMLGRDGEVRPLSMASLRELGVLLKEFNRENGLEPGKGALTLREFLSRDMQGLSSPTELGRMLQLRLPSGQEDAFRGALDRMLNQGGISAAQRAGFDTRSGDLPGIGAGRDAASRADGRVTETAGQKAIETAGQKLAESAGQKAAESAAQRAADAAAAAAAQAVNTLDSSTMMPTGTNIDQSLLDLEDERRARELEEQRQAKLAEEEQNRLQELGLAALRDKETQDLQDRELKERLEKEEKERLEREEKERREREEKEREEEEKNRKKLDDRRQRYTVQERDTLESIASRMLSDSGLNGLIYEINQNAIPVQKVGGKKLLDLKPKLVIWLPSPAEIKDYRERPFVFSQKFEYVQNQQFASVEDELKAVLGANWDGAPNRPDSSGSIADTADSKTSDTSDNDSALAVVAGSQARRSNIEKAIGPIYSKKDDSVEKEGRIKYVVRLGDTLKSIAMRHPALEDVSFWRLVAEVNGLSTSTDDKGVPVASLKRGTTLWIPAPDEIEQFRQKNEGTKPAAKPKAKPAPTIKKTETFSAAPDANAANRNADGTLNFEPNDEEDVTRVILEAAGLLPKSSSTDRASKSRAAEDLKKRQMVELPGKQSTDLESENYTIQQLSETARLVHIKDAGVSNSALGSRLEVLKDNQWRPVVSYEIYPDIALRHEFSLDGKKRTVRIDLPPASVQELAENELSNNWSQYCQKYLTGESISD